MVSGESICRCPADRRIVNESDDQREGAVSNHEAVDSNFGAVCDEGGGVECSGDGGEAELSCDDTIPVEALGSPSNRRPASFSDSIHVGW